MIPTSLCFQVSFFWKFPWLMNCCCCCCFSFSFLFLFFSFFFQTELKTRD